MNVTKGLKQEPLLLTLILNVVTFGIYGSFYLKHQTEALNEHVPADKQISDSMVSGIVTLACVSGFLDLITLLTEAGEMIDGINTLLGLVFSISMIVWVFKWRSLYHEALKVRSSNDGRWMNGFFAFLFGVYYVNYKVGALLDEQAQS